MKKNTNNAFSLAELMIVMLILTIILAATMPILSKRAKVKAAAAAGKSFPPIVNEGDPCETTTDTMGISSDHNTLFTCMQTAPESGSCPTIGEYAVVKNGTVITRLQCQ